MFEIVDIYGNTLNCFGVEIDKEGYQTFVLCDGLGNFFKTEPSKNHYKLKKQNNWDYIKDSITNWKI